LCVRREALISVAGKIRLLAMRAETERTIEEIKQALTLLRRHL
jgi:hypothetical protein